MQTCKIIKPDDLLLLDGRNVRVTDMRHRTHLTQNMLINTKLMALYPPDKNGYAIYINEMQEFPDKFRILFKEEEVQSA